MTKDDTRPVEIVEVPTPDGIEVRVGDMVIGRLKSLKVADPIEGPVYELETMRDGVPLGMLAETLKLGVGYESAQKVLAREFIERPAESIEAHNKAVDSLYEMLDKQDFATVEAAAARGPLRQQQVLMALDFEHTERRTLLLEAITTIEAVAALPSKNTYVDGKPVAQLTCDRDFQAKLRLLADLGRTYLKKK